VKTAVVILNYNGRKFLEEFLPSVVLHSKNDAEIIVADNCSKDDSVKFLQKNYPEIRIIINVENGGFAKGYNDALKQIDAEYFVLLNSDIEVSENWIKPVISLLDSDKSIAAAQPKILAFQSKNKFEHAGACGGFIDHYSFPFCRGRIFNITEEDNGQYDDAREVFWATGAALFIRAELFRGENGFSEYFFAHMEEIDLCWRLKNKGHKIYVVPHSKVYHVGGGTLNYMSPFKTYLNFRNNLFLIYRNKRNVNLFSYLFKRLCLDGLAGIKFLTEGKFKHCYQIIRAHFHFYQALPRLKKERAILIKNDSNLNQSGIYPGSIVIDFFRAGKRIFSDLNF
jgi:GT2 family glycosyltransferase